MNRPVQRPIVPLALAGILATAVGAAAPWPTGHPLHAAVAHAADPTEQERWHTCGMHPEVVQRGPGTCPKCGMNLEPMSPDRVRALGLDGADEADGDAPAPGRAEIRIDPVTEQNMGVRIDRVTRGPVTRTVRTVAFIDYDETTRTVVTTKVDGWIEKLFVDRTGMQVHAGDALFELYSPELFSAQQEYLAALRGRRGAASAGANGDALVRDARTRLEFFDISREQIRGLQAAGKASKTLTIRASFTGIVTHKNVLEGQMVKAGADLIQIADVSKVWAIGKVYENDLPYVAPGQEAFMTLGYLPGKTFRGRVTYVYPYLSGKSREVAVRMEFHNPGYELKPGMYATISLTGEVEPAGILVPDVAVIHTGTRHVAFVALGDGRFEARQLQVGARSEGNRLQVLSGLAPGEDVVVSGQFLLDSESRLREAALKFLPRGDGGVARVNAATPVQAATDAASRDADEQPGELYWVCPMPEHVGTLLDRPGPCPLCAMATVPVRRVAGHVVDPVITHWTCPMSEHGHVHEDGPGDCPLCGMELVPVTGAVDPAPPGGTWTCPMDSHAHVREEGPGKCPLCGMELVPAPQPAPAPADHPHGGKHVHPE